MILNKYEPEELPWKKPEFVIIEYSAKNYSYTAVGND